MAHFRRQYPSRRSSRLAVGFVCVAVLTACGLIGDDPPETEPPPDPNQTTITAFKTSAAYIERGDEVTLSWEVDNPGSDPSVPEPCTLTRHAQGQEPEEPFGVECTGSLTEVPTAPDTAAYVSYQLNVLKNVDDGAGQFATRAVTVFFLPDDTEITSFTVSDTHVDRDTPVTLSWTVANTGDAPEGDEPCSITRQPENEPASEPTPVDCTSQLTEIPQAPATSSYVVYTLRALAANGDPAETHVSASVTVFLNPSATSGEPQWARAFAPGGDDRAFAIAVDLFGNSFVVGDTTGGLEGPNHGGTDAFVRAYDAQGNVSWTRQFGTPQDDDAAAVAVDAHGNVYVAGTTNGSLQGASTGGADGYLRKYDDAGDELWTLQFGTAADDFVNAIALDAEGQPVLAGTTHGDLTRPVEGASDMFVRLYDTAGDHLSTTMHGGSGSDEARGLSVGDDGDLFVAGLTEGDTEDFADATDGILLRLDPLGNLQWAFIADVDTYDMASAVAVDDAGASYLALDTYGVHGDAFTYALKVDAAGTEAWSEAVSGTSNIVIDSFWENSRSGIVTDWVGDIVVVARVQDHIPGPAEGAWIRKFAPNGQDLWTSSFTADDVWTAPSAVAVDGSSRIYVAGITVAESYSYGDNRLDALVATFAP